MNKDEVLKVIDNKIDVIKAKAQQAARVWKCSRAASYELVEETLEETKKDIARLFDEEEQKNG